MADINPRDPETGPAEGASADAAPTAPSNGDEGSAEALAQEVADLKDRLLRTLAEMENLRRRTEREVVEARSRGVAAFAADVLSVADNMRRALDAVGPDLRESADAGVKALIEGVELTERDLLKAFEKHGMKKLEPQGEKFDPNFHQAMYEVPDPTVPAGTVVQVVQAGYTLGDRMLRPALVAVAKGGAKPAPTAGNDNAGAPDSSSDS